MLKDTISASLVWIQYMQTDNLTVSIISAILGGGGGGGHYHNEYSKIISRN